MKYTYMFSVYNLKFNTSLHKNSLNQFLNNINTQFFVFYYYKKIKKAY